MIHTERGGTLIEPGKQSEIKNVKVGKGSEVAEKIKKMTNWMIEWIQ